MENGRPRGREKHVTGPGRRVEKHGQGLGTGPVGDPGGYAGRGRQGQGGGSGGKRSGGGGGMKLIILLLAALLGGGGGITALLGGQGGAPSSHTTQTAPSLTQQQPASGGAGWMELLGGLNGGSVSSGWQGSANTGKLNTAVASGAREKYTRLLGGGRDTATIMVYLCGTDLESRSSMGTYDLQEMLEARLGNQVNLLVYTGGCREWKNSAVSSTDNQIWQVKDGRLLRVRDRLGSVSMTDPDTLSQYIQWCAANYPASRYGLILWDHGGGSVSGYGYDEKFPRSGSMDLAGLDRALTGGGVKFDFLGFDACLMATVETALTVAPYADYLIASEETEPGVGWYYTNWLTDLGSNPSRSTLELGKRIVDDFVETCAQKCRGQSTTLSVVDLAELERTLPGAFSGFSKSTAELLRNQKFETVSTARSGAREFARSSRIDQVDLAHLARRLETEEGRVLADTLLSAVKYNRTSSDMTNAYGLSIYFPGQKLSMVDKAASTYREIGLDESYTRCIRQYASMSASGQAASGGTASPLPALLGSALGGGSGGGSDMVGALLGQFLGGGFDRVSGLTGDNTDFLSDRALSDEDTARYLENHRFPGEALLWQENGSGEPVLYLGEDAWRLTRELELNLFYDDGEGYIDLGLDNVFDFDESGGLLGRNDNTWLAIDGQVVAYYHMSTVDDGTHYTITGRVPVLHNGVRAELLLAFDDENPYGYVSGVRSVYLGGETETVAKAQAALEPGDTLEFLCDYYTYGGEYRDSYRMGEPVTVTEEALSVGDVPLLGTTRATYRFTDLYGQHYWTPVVPAP